MEVVNPPPKKTVCEFWKSIWSQPGKFNQEAKWLPDLREGYCRNVQMHIDQIRLEHFNKVTDKLKDCNSPGRDLVVGYWIKRNNSLRQKTFEIYQKINSNEVEIPEWLVKARTTLAAKNRNTHDPKNYRPIAYENIIMKVYTGCLALLIEEHCIENEIIFPEQAGAKKGMWECADQLLINKTVCEEVK